MEKISILILKQLGFTDKILEIMALAKKPKSKGRKKTKEGEVGKNVGL